MKILVTGCGGQLGRAVAEELQSRGHTVVRTDRKNMDITDREAVERMLLSEEPDVIVHCAAYTNVEHAEEEPSLCRMANVQGTAHIAKYCKRQGRKLLYISTDYGVSNQCIRAEQIRRGADRTDAGQIFHRQDVLGIWKRGE